MAPLAAISDNRSDLETLKFSCASCTSSAGNACPAGRACLRNVRHGPVHFHPFNPQTVTFSSQELLPLPIQRAKFRSKCFHPAHCILFSTGSVINTTVVLFQPSRITGRFQHTTLIGDLYLQILLYFFEFLLVMPLYSVRRRVLNLILQFGDFNIQLAALVFHGPGIGYGVQLLSVFVDARG